MRPNAVPAALALAAAVVVGLAGFGARGTARAAGSDLNACQRLAGVLHSTARGWGDHLSTRHFGRMGAGWRCELSSKPVPGSVQSEWSLLLYSFQGHSTALAHTNWAELLKGAEAAKKAGLVRLTGTRWVSDEAFEFGTESTNSLSATIIWRRGRYWGWLSFGAPRPQVSVGAAERFFVDLMRAFPRG